MNGMNEGSTCKRTSSPTDKLKMHAKGCAHQWMKGRKSTFANRWACQAFQHASKDKHAKDSSSEWNTIEDFVHFAMWRWRFDTPWRHPSPNNIVARHAFQKQHKCTNTIMLSYVISHVAHISTIGYIVNQCNVTWKSKRPTCCTKIHAKSKSPGSQTFMRVVEQPQGLVSPLAINTTSFVHAKDFLPHLLPHSQEGL